MVNLHWSSYEISLPWIFQLSELTVISVVRMQVCMTIRQGLWLWSVIMKWNRQYQSPNPAYQLATEEYLTSKKLKESREQEFLKTISQGVCLLGSVFLVLTHLLVAVPAAIYLLKVNNGNTRTSCVICSKLTIKTLERCSMASFWCLYC